MKLTNLPKCLVIVMSSFNYTVYVECLIFDNDRLFVCFWFSCFFIIDVSIYLLEVSLWNNIIAIIFNITL